MPTIYVFSNDHTFIGIVRGDLDCSCWSDQGAACDSCRRSLRWLDGSPMVYMNWITPTEPSMSSGVSGYVIQYSDGGWSDKDDAYDYPYVCKREVRYVDYNLKSLDQFLTLRALRGLVQVLNQRESTKCSLLKVKNASLFVFS